MGPIFGHKAPMPGMTPEFDVTPSEFLLDDHKILRGIVIDSSARDAGNSNQQILRPGLALGQITSSGNFAQYNPSASNGTQVGKGILYEQCEVVDNYGNATNASGIRVIHGLVDSTKVIGADAGFYANLPMIEPLGVGSSGLDQ